MMGGYGLMAGMGWLGIMTMAIFWVGVIVLVVWGISTLSAQSRHVGTPDALEILKQRFARGEIGRDEYQQAREALR